MHQHVTTPTRGRGTETPSVLDLVFSNEAELVEGVTTNAPLGASDHSVLEIDFRCHPGELPPKVSYSYEKADFKKMRDMMDIDWEKILGDCEDDVNTQWEIFHNKYKQAEEACVPKIILKTSKKKFSIPLDKRTLAKKRRKHRLWQRFLETDDGKVYTEYRRCSNQLRRLTRNATKIFEKGIAKSAKTQPKKFWKYVSSKTKAINKIPDLYMDDNCDPNNMAKTDEEKAESLATFFSSVFTKELDGMWELSNKPEIKTELNLDISKDAILKKLNKIKISKSPGPDSIHPRVLRELSQELVTPLSLIFETSVRTGTLPNAWKQANITALHKKGSRHVAGNYRPVSLTSVVCKLLESLIRDALVTYMKQNGLFSNKQFGFIIGRSTTLQLLKVLDRWTEILDAGGYVDVIYCDFKKAFDTVPHKRLMNVLKYYSIQDPVLSWIEAFLKDRKQRVLINGAPSTWHDVISGIPQGSVLGPVLFVVYINTLADTVTDSEVYMFADDTKMFKGIFGEDDELKLQQDLNQIHNWSQDSLMQYHPEKTSAMRITTNRRELPPPEYYMNGKLLSVSEEEKDLGVIIDSNLTFDKHISAKINKGNSTMGLIRRTMEYMDEENFRLLYTALVRPHLEYANAVWSPYLKKHITATENVQRRATRLVPGLSKLSYEERLRRLRLPTLSYRRYRGDMIEVFKITHGLYDGDVTAGFLQEQKDSITRGHKYSLFKRHSNLNMRKFSFANRVVDQWNNLPDSVVHAETVQSFESRLDKLWKESEVMYDHDCDVKLLTSSRNLRYTNTCAQPENDDITCDLMSEA